MIFWTSTPDIPDVPVNARIPLSSPLGHLVAVRGLLLRCIPYSTPVHPLSMTLILASVNANSQLEDHFGSSSVNRIAINYNSGNDKFPSNFDEPYHIHYIK